MIKNVKKATESDIARIAEILVFTKRVSYRPIFKNDNVSFNVITVLNVIDEIKSIGIDNTYVYDDGIIKGMTRFTSSDDELEINELYVDVFFQKSGVGAALINFVFEQAKFLGKKKVSLWVLEKNSNAIDFYKSKGLKCTEERKEFADTKQYLLKFSREV